MRVKEEYSGKGGIRKHWRKDTDISKRIYTGNGDNSVIQTIRWTVDR